MARVHEEFPHLCRSPLLAIAVHLVIARATGIVAFTDRSAVAAAKHVAHHIATIDSDIGVAIHLACGEAGDLGYIFITNTPIAIGVIVIMLQSHGIGISTFTSTIDVVSDEAFFEGDASVFVHMTVFAATVNGTREATQRTVCCPITPFGVESGFIVNTTCISRFVVVGCGVVVRIVDDHLGVVGIGAVGHHIAVAGNALTTSIHVAIVLTSCLEQSHLIGIRKVIHMTHIILVIVNRLSIGIPRAHVVLTSHTDTSVIDDNSVVTSLLCIFELIRPTKGEALGLIIMNGRPFCESTH